MSIKVDPVKEYVKKVKDDVLKNLYSRLIHNFNTDMAESMIILQREEGINQWLLSANTSEAFYSMLDYLTAQVEAEFKHRFVKNK